MEDKEAIEMMERASREIKDLRAQISRLQPRAEAFDALQDVLSLLPQKSHGMGEDWAWELDRRAAELKKNLESEGETS